MNENQGNDYDEQRGRFQRRTNKFSQLVCTGKSLESLQGQPFNERRT